MSLVCNVLLWCVFEMWKSTPACGKHTSIRDIGALDLALLEKLLNALTTCTRAPGGVAKGEMHSCRVLRALKQRTLMSAVRKYGAKKCQEEES
jgi:hypothetical protein